MSNQPKITFTHASVNGVKRPDLVQSNYDLTRKGREVLAEMAVSMFDAAILGKQTVTIDAVEVKGGK